MVYEEKVKLIRDIKGSVLEEVDMKRDFPDEEIEDIITRAVFRKAEEKQLSLFEKTEIIEEVFNSIRRLDVLQPIIEDSTVTEIMINGPDAIYIEKEGKIHKLEAKFENRERLEDVVQSIVSKVNRTVNEANPIVDARLKDGSRVGIVLPPVALNGPFVTIRKFPEKPMTAEQLIKLNSITPEAAEFLKLLVHAKYNIFICGGTGSGKTSFLNALSNFIPYDERVITIEDSAELQIKGIDNILKMETRNSNTEGKGEITIKHLIKASLRMRPERIVVGEVRGEEALDMLQAMNTGHDGSLSTGHANSSKDMLSRLETMVLCGAALPLAAIRQQIASAIDIIIHLSRLRDKSRRTMEISEVAGLVEGNILLNPLFVFCEEGEAEDGRIIGSLKRTGNEMLHKEKLKLSGYKNII